MLLAQTHEFTDDELAPAIAATFKRRGIAMPEELPDCLTRAFAFGLAYDLHIDEVEESLDSKPRSCSDPMLSNWSQRF
jgi:hypothetical protein